MARLKMTQAEQEAAEEQAAQERANEATADLSPDERKAEIESKAEAVAEDVVRNVKKDERPKKAAKKAAKKTPARTPATEANTKPERHDPLEGVTIDPDENYPKILHMIVTVGDDDQRSLEEFSQDVKDAILSQANAKMATILTSKYAIDGKHILSHHYDAEVARLRGDDSDE